MKLLRLILATIKWLIMIGITLLAIYILSSNFNILGGYRSYLVQSGSMEPAIMTGDVVVIQNRNTYQINDVVTFTMTTGRIVTHRIVTVNQGGVKTYSTKGDANRTGDEDTITEQQIIGKVILVIPKLGYIVAFCKSRSGLLYLLILPALVLILDELVKIKKNVKTRN